MGYIGKQPETGRYGKLDQISAGFNGSTATFNLTVDSEAVYPVNSQALIISLNGVLQQPGTDYTVSAATITFTTNPASGVGFFGVILGDSLDIGTPSDGSVTVAKMAANSVDSDQYVDGSIDNAHLADDAVDSDELAAGSVDTAHLGNLQVTGAKIAANTITGDKIALGSDAQGDVMHYNGTDWVRLGYGTSGHFLKTQGASANPTWAAGGGDLSFGGDTFGANKVIGSNDDYDLAFETNGTTRITLENDGSIKYLGAVPSGGGEGINADNWIQQRVTNARNVPSNSSSNIHLGEDTGNIVFVWGMSESPDSNRFVDMVAYGASQTPVVITSQTVRGSPAGRTYGINGYNLTLQMASGTYNIMCMGWGCPPSIA